MREIAFSNLIFMWFLIKPWGCFQKLVCGYFHIDSSTEEWRQTGQDILQTALPTPSSVTQGCKSSGAQTSLYLLLSLYFQGINCLPGALLRRRPSARCSRAELSTSLRTALPGSRRRWLHSSPARAQRRLIRPPAEVLALRLDDAALARSHHCESTLFYQKCN